MKNNPKIGWQLVCEKFVLSIPGHQPSIVNSKYISKRLPNEYNATKNYEILAVAVFINNQMRFRTLSDI